MAMEPAAISARPATTTRRLLSTAPEMPAARAKGTVRPSDMPITTSRTTSPAVKWRSMWGVCGMISQFGVRLKISKGLPSNFALALIAEPRGGLVKRKPEGVLNFDLHRGGDIAET